MTAKAENVCPIFKRGLEDGSAQTISGDKTISGTTLFSGLVYNTSYQIDGTTDGSVNAKKFRYMKASGSALANGDVVVLDPSVAAGDAVMRTTTADHFPVVGVATDTVTSGSYGGIQIYGAHTGVKIDATTTGVTIGDRLATGTITAKANKMKTTTVVGGCLGVALAIATAGSDSNYAVFIDPR